MHTCLLRATPAASSLAEEPQIGDVCEFADMKHLQVDTVGTSDHAVVRMN
jgi:hypothetical protein